MASCHITPVVTQTPRLFVQPIRHTSTSLFTAAAALLQTNATASKPISSSATTKKRTIRGRPLTAVWSTRTLRNSALHQEPQRRKLFLLVAPSSAGLVPKMWEIFTIRWPQRTNRLTVHRCLRQQQLHQDLSMASLINSRNWMTIVVNSSHQVFQPAVLIIIQMVILKQTLPQSYCL